MRWFLSIVLALGLVLSFSLVTAVPAQGATYDVPGNYPTIQAALAVAVSGDIIYVAAGPYNEDIDLVNGVQVLGAGADVTTITGTGTGPVVDADGLPSLATLFDGFTVEDGNAGVGGGMYINASSLTVSNCVFQNNYTGNDGGGMYILDASPTVIGCTFDTNTADTRGGGIACLGISSSPIIANNIIVNNAVTDLNGRGGGGIYAAPGSSPTIINNTIVNNMVTGLGTYGGGGIFADNTPSTTITNNIIVGNDVTSPMAIGGGGICAHLSSPIISYNDVFGNTSVPNPAFDNYYGCVPGPGDISVDPNFDDPEYHIIYPDSPCIDAGDNAAVTAALLTTDFEGEPRIFDGDDDGTATVDMGADEYYVPPPPPPPSGRVGGTVYPIDKAALLLPWLGLGAVLILAAGGLILIRRRS